jgi:hypothetical protein
VNSRILLAVEQNGKRFAVFVSRWTKHYGNKLGIFKLFSYLIDTQWSKDSCHNSSTFGLCTCELQCNQLPNYCRREVHLLETSIVSDSIESECSLFCCKVQLFISYGFSYKKRIISCSMF